MHRKVAAALVAALALAVASCGGSEETLTRAELVRRIETACKEGTRAGEKQARATRGTNALVTAFLASQRALQERLDDVNASDAAKADFEAFKEGVQARIDAAERLASTERADFQRAAAALQPAADQATRRIDAAIRRLGVEGCG